MVKVADNQVGEVVAAKIASCMRGTTQPGLDSFAATHLSGPHAVTGTLYGRKKARKPFEPPPPPLPDVEGGGEKVGSGSGGVLEPQSRRESSRGGSAAAAAEKNKKKAQNKAPPVIPGLRLVSGL
jgi:hypothetical protein